tara:strand:- start:280 stop:2301 length:2022 start_codon:yes stop_codon:yes gene_type:complete
MQNYNSNSSFWLNTEDDFDVLTGEKIKVGKDLHKLSGIRKAISNFVNITTGQSIPVKFSSGDQSYTDGKTVVISSNIKDKDFDSTVGLALHEGSHIKLTDFNVLSKLNSSIKQNIDVDSIKEKYNMEDDHDAVWYIHEKVKDLLNIIEDRRIDYHIFKSAPGYKGYYHAMYDKYFNASIIDKALKQGAKNDPTKWDDYLFHIANFANPNRNLGVLPVLKDVWNIINLSNIQRLENTMQALSVAFTVFKTIEESIPKPGDCKQPKGGNCKGGNKKQPKGGNCNGNGQGQEPKQGPSGGAADDGSKTQGTDVEDNTPNLDPKLTPSQENSLNRQIQKQKDFSNGNIKKSKLSKADSKKVEAMEKSGTEIKNTGKGEIDTWYGKKQFGGYDTVLIKNFNKSLIDSNVYDNIFNYWESQNETNQVAIDKGLSLGTMLGRKLQVRNESSSLKNSRLNKGKIDKRLIASLGFGNENVFEQTFVTRYNDAYVHLSIDASGSMHGNRFEKATIAAVAIAKAASMIQGLNVTISYRTTTNIGNKYCPCILMAYDSTKDKISKIRNIFKYIACNGTTPEGLCFEAIQNEIVEGSNNIDSYFINFSDGEPYFCGQGQDYYGVWAQKHTKEQVDNMRSKGIKILSYMIDGNADNFKKMYGKDAESVNVSQLIPLAKTLNQMFLDK